MTSRYTPRPEPSKCEDEMVEFLSHWTFNTTKSCQPQIGRNSRGSLKMPHPSTFAGRHWHSQHHAGYMISADNSLLQTDVINKAFGSEQLWWARPCFCLGVYQLGETSADGSHRGVSDCFRMSS
jgi:hypothetical protein